MRKLCKLAFLFLLLAPVSVFAQLPAKTPFQPEVWQTYTHNVLNKLEKGTQYEELASKITFDIELKDEVGASTNLTDEISITKGLILLMRDEADCAAVIGHEFGHITLGHHPSTTTERIHVPCDYDYPVDDMDGPCVMMVDITDFPLMEKQELEADQFSIAVLKRNGYDPCAFSRIFEATLRSDGRLDQKEPDQFVQVHLRRLKVGKTVCAPIPEKKE